MTGPRSVPVHPHRTRARRLLPFLAAIILGPSACSEPTMPGNPSTEVSAGSARLHPYRVSKPAGSASFYQVAKSAALVSFGNASTSASSILLLADEDGVSTTALANSIADAGFLVTVRPAPEYTWDATNPSLDGFDLVIHLNGNTFGEGQTLSTAAQTALVDFVRAGGGFVGAQWSGYEASTTQAGMQDLVLAGFIGPVEENCGSCPITYSAVAEQQTHPVLAGLPSAFTFEADGHASGEQVWFATHPSTVLSTVMSGAPGVLVRSLDAGKVVNFSFAPNYSLGGVGQTLQDANIRQLYVNAVRWAARAATEPTKAPATISLIDPMPAFDGTAKSVSVTTNPSGLTGVTLTYSQAGVNVTAPVNAGVYQVLATLAHDDYEAPQATGTLTIRRATPAISWTNPSAIALGTPLGSVQLNASATGVGGSPLSGEFIYLPAANTVLPAGENQPISVEFIPSDVNYTNTIKTVTITVLASPTLPSNLRFTGFFEPIHNLPAANLVMAGSALPVRFSIAGASESRVLQFGSPKSFPASCGSASLEKSFQETVAGSSSHLHVDGEKFTYVWKTSLSWAGTCRKLVVTLVDGSTHEALFHFAREQKGKQNKSELKNQGQQKQIH